MAKKAEQDHREDPLFGIAAPKDDGMERHVLNCMATFSDTIPAMYEAGLSVDDFTEMAHKAFFIAIDAIYRDGGVPNIQLLNDRLRRDGNLELVGGFKGVLSLVEHMPLRLMGGVNAAERLIEMTTARRIMAVGEKIVRDAAAETVTGNKLVDHAAALVREVAKTRTHTVQDPKQAFRETLDRLKAPPGNEKAIYFGLEDIDRLLRVGRGEQVVVSARTSVGKTAFMVNVSLRHALRTGEGVLLFGFEMGDHEYRERWISMESGVPMDKVKTYGATPDQVRAMEDAVAKIDSLPLYVVDSGGMTIDEGLSIARRMLDQHPEITIISWDHIGKTAGRKPGAKRYDVVQEASGALKAFARDHNVTSFVLAQVGRDVAKENGKVSKKGERRPGLHDLRDCGDIEQDADKVIMLHRPESSDIKSPVGYPVEAHIRKNRQGRLGSVDLFFKSPTSTFVNSTTGTNRGGWPV